LFIIRKFYT